jgi:hypothetical protein
MSDTSTLHWDLNSADLPRLLHSGETWEGQPYIFADKTGVEISAGESQRPDVGISVDAQFGTQVVGPFSIADMPQNISFCSGYFRLNPTLLSCIGSSSAMPIPTLVWGTPRVLAAKQDMQSVAAAVGM